VSWPGLPRRRVDQVRQPGTAATAPGSSSIVRARYVIVSGPGDGVFVYQAGTTPGLGNPPIEWSTSGSVDPYGNVLPSAGTGTQSGGGAWVALEGGQIDFRGGGQIGSTLSGNIVISLPGELAVEGGPIVSETASGGTLADPTVITTDTGTAASTFGTDWAPSGSGVNGVAFTLGNDGWVTVLVDVHTTGAAPVAEICAIPAAAYTPASSFVCGGIYPTAGGAGYVLSVTSGGQLQTAGIPTTSGVRYAGMGRYPLAAVA
jgi:hypothetical protein